MTQTVAARPVPLSRVWSHNKIIADDLQGDDLGDVLELHSEASAWWVLPRQHEEVSIQLRDAASALDLDDLAMKDLVAEDRRATFEELGHARLVTTNAVILDRQTAELTVHAVSMVTTDRAMICLVDPVGDEFNPAHLLAKKSDQLADGGVECALQLVLGAVISTYENAVEWLEDSNDQLANALFEERPLNKSEQLWAFKLRTALSQLRRLTDPMRAVVDELVETQPEQDRLTARRWSTIQEQHHRVANAADALREALSSVFDTSLALAELRMNSIMKKLTGWAAIIAVPTLVTGFVGMNVEFPLDGTASGFWLYAVIMVVAVMILFVVFRRKEWI